MSCRSGREKSTHGCLSLSTLFVLSGRVHPEVSARLVVTAQGPSINAGILQARGWGGAETRRWGGTQQPAHGAELGAATGAQPVSPKQAPAHRASGRTPVWTVPAVPCAAGASVGSDTVSHE